ncbi:hypothetical protein C8R42DRAFT_644503 [Lentinula raphanica]|nr:hypothetical protein C8R42DRAFT_644503 [Lentinula raphanica]
MLRSPVAGDEDEGADTGVIAGIGDNVGAGAGDERSNAGVGAGDERSNAVVGAGDERSNAVVGAGDKQSKVVVGAGDERDVEVETGGAVESAPEVEVGTAGVEVGTDGGTPLVMISVPDLPSNIMSITNACGTSKTKKLFDTFGVEFLTTLVRKAREWIRVCLLRFNVFFLLVFVILCLLRKRC